MNDYFSQLIDFTVISPHLLQAKTPESFEIWLEKLEKIDRRALKRFLILHKNEIPKAHFRIAQARFIEDL